MAGDGRIADLKSLTSFRFFAALWVVLFHFGDQLPLDYLAMNPILHGQRAVDFFFILSGFILAHVYGGQLASGRFVLRSFLVKRLARLYPVHVLALFGSLAFFIGAHLLGVQINNAAKYDLRQFVPNLLLISTWFPFVRPAFNLPAWSISAEFAAYLLFPFIARAVLSPRFGARTWVAISIVLFAVFELFSKAVFGHSVLRLIEMGVFRIMPLFVLGIVLWKGWSARVFVPPLWLLLPLMVVALVLAPYPMLDVPVFALIVLIGAEQTVAGKEGAFGSGRLVFLGEASYSLYMTHGLVQTVYYAVLGKLHVPLTQLPVALAAFAIGLVLCVLVSILTYLLVEAPCRNLITRWAHTRLRAPESTVVI
ncbi:acyltransferase family protein [Sphingomonas hylomeconis]|uniref:Acyltransferase family protein n=1 Tax=Sphingomonas hylomeconis TaxID=1395958 RepID=A0ABV7STY1_9SPHN|nr:acyltransferase [Sphingomonas hylomeconis]